MKVTLSVFVIFLFTALFLIAQEETTLEENKDNSYKEKLFSAALYSSIDSIKTSVNLDFSYPVIRFTKREIRGNTSVIGYKLFDSNNPNLYMFGFGQRLSFGRKRQNVGQVEITRYGFTFFSIGWMSFDSEKNPKFLFTTPLFYEVGGGAGFNIFATDYMSIILEIGGGVNKVIGDNDYFGNMKSGAFGKISVGSRYYF